MIRKNTKLVFESKEDKMFDDLKGGMPLSKGEIVNVHDKDDIISYEVVDKKIDIFLEGEDQTVNITYVLKRKD